MQIESENLRQYRTTRHVERPRPKRVTTTQQHRAASGDQRCTVVVIAITVAPAVLRLIETFTGFDREIERRTNRRYALPVITRHRRQVGAAARVGPLPTIIIASTACVCVCV